jgi:predicted regulator of Ras-like GTPase activity (Roadblock/LC7/MglB family)
MREKINPILARLAGTEGMKQALLVVGQEILHAGAAPAAESTEKVTTLVRMLADVTRRASVNMKHGEARQVLMFGPQGIAVVSQSVPGILVLVGGASVKVGLLRLALNDCLKRLSEVN